MRGVPQLNINDSFVCVLERYPFPRRICYCFLALVGDPAELKVARASQIAILFQNIRNGIRIPSAGIVWMIPSCSSGALKFERPRRRYLLFLEHTGDFTGTIALGAEPENQPDIRRGFLVHIQVSILTAEIAIGCLRGNALTGHSLVAKYSAYLLARVLGIPFVDDIPKRSEIVRQEMERSPAGCWASNQNLL